MFQVKDRREGTSSIQLITVKYEHVKSGGVGEGQFFAEIAEPIRAHHHSSMIAEICACCSVPRYRLSWTTCQAAALSNESELSPCLLNQAWQREGGEEASGSD